jgi:hypothetical protein
MLYSRHSFCVKVKLPKPHLRPSKRENLCSEIWNLLAPFVLYDVDPNRQEGFP